jgi:flagellar biosynthesis chaperone FliJ
MRIADCVRREEALRREFDGVLASANPERGGEIDPALREERWSYLSALDAVVQQTREERRTLEDEAAVMEDRLRMAVRDRRILETLKEARLAAHRDAGRRREAKRMDFLATTTRREAAL